MNHRGIGSTRIAMLTGHSPWGGPWECYRGIVDGWKPEPNFRMELGILMEPVVLELFRRAKGIEHEKPGTIVHPEFPHVVDSPDGIGKGEDVVVEAKTCDPFLMDDFGADGTDEVRPAYLVQCQWHLGVCRAVYKRDFRRCFMPVLFGTRELRIYEVAWDADMFDGLLTVAHDFWRRHIEPRNPPPIDGSKACSGYLAANFGPPKAHRMPADDKAHRVAQQLRKARSELQKWTDAVRLHENEIKASIADTDGLYGPDWTATWKENKNGQRVFRLKFHGEGAEQ